MLSLFECPVAGPGDCPAVDVALTGTGVRAKADVAISIGAMPNPVQQNRSFTYVISVRNFGSAAGRVRVTDTLPSVVSFISASTTHGSCTTPAPATPAR